MVGASGAPELAFRELLLWADPPNQPLGLPSLEIQIPVLELRALWSGTEAVFQRTGILSRRMVERGRVEKDLVATAETLPHPHPHTHTLFFPPDVLRLSHIQPRVNSTLLGETIQSHVQ